MIVKVPMMPFQSVLYNWVKASGTIRLDPDSALAARTLRTFVPLNNKCMELRKVRIQPLGPCGKLSRLSGTPETVSAEPNTKESCMRICVYLASTLNLPARGSAAQAYAI